MRAEMKSFTERSPYRTAAIGVFLIVTTVLVSLDFRSLPFVISGTEYAAYFAEAGGLTSGATVQVLGADAGSVSSVELDGNRVLVTFKVDEDINLGDRTEAAVKLANTLGSKLLEVTPRGEGRLTAPIPLDRTTPAYQLPDALADLSNTISGLDTQQLSDSLAVVSQELSDTPPALKEAVRGLARLSDTLNERDRDLRKLLENANAATGVLAEHSNQVVNLVTKANSLLAYLTTERGALDQLSNNLSSLARQLKGVITENRDTLRPALDKLNGVLGILDNRKERIQKAIKQLNAFAAGLGESVSAGPGFKANVGNLPPGQFIQPFIDAAFADLGLDPATLLPTQIGDPLTGQPALPPLPTPFPRTGQGGPPRLTIPDAITGNAGDQPCGLPGLLLPGPGCYPLRDEPPAPPPGGPPPGPPAPTPPGPMQSVQPTTGPDGMPAPGQIPPTQEPVLHGPGPIVAPQPTEGGGQ
jgi:phospholipid/cholesterol/gamma-HCH transport system substrate-binding protein